jgi:hypothetical protein
MGFVFILYTMHDISLFFLVAGLQKQCLIAYFLMNRRPAFALCRGQDIAATVQSYQSLAVSLSSVSSLKVFALYFL